MLTAGHCGYVGQAWSNGNLSRSIGSVTNEWTAKDVMLIHTDANKYMWDGGASTNTFTKTVTGWDWAYPNELLCVSGRSTGATCGWKNSREFAYSYCTTDVFGSHECYDDLIYATKSGTSTAAGDSGGPVFYTDGGPQVTAKGVLSGGSAGVIVYQDFATAMQHWNITPIT